MTFLPIVGRELRVASRHRSTYWIRLLVALGAIGIGGWIMVMTIREVQQHLGITLFVSLSILTFIYSLLAGVLKTADCLSEEKREGTLGLLFLTDLKGYDIVFGKLAATSLNAFYGMLAVFPVMAIPLLVGGVTIQEFWRVVLVAVNTLFFSLSVGMFCSAVSREDRKAVVWAFIVLFVFAIALPVAGLILYWENGSPRVFHPVWFVPSPSYACFLAFEASYTNLKAFNLFYESIACTHGLSWLLLLLSVLIVPRTWQDKGESMNKLQRRARWQRFAIGGGHLSFRRRLLAINPIYWLSSRDRSKGLAIWAFLAAGGLLWTWGLIVYPNDWKQEEAYVWTALTCHLVLKLWVALEASRCFGADRKSGALELLLSTPMSVKEIVGGQMMALRRQFVLPALVVFVADFIFLAARRSEMNWVLGWSGLMVVFATDLITLSWVGMWMGLVSRNTTRAAAASVVRILVLPWMIVALFAMVNMLVPQLVPSGWEDKTFLTFMIALALLNNLVFGIWAGRRLLGRLRQVATQGYDTRRIPDAPVKPA